MARKFVTLLVVASFAGFVFAVAGCGGDDNKSAATTETSATTTATTPTTEATETTSTETTEATTTTSTNGVSAADCQEFAQIGAKISSALTGSTDVQKLKDAFAQLTAAAPADIKDDFQTLSDYIGQVADALQGVQAGQTPSAAQLAKLQSIDTTAVTQASQNIAKWTTDNCTG